jgi:hypothetical protein
LDPGDQASTGNLDGSSDITCLFSEKESRNEWAAIPIHQKRVDQGLTEEDEDDTKCGIHGAKSNLWSNMADEPDAKRCTREGPAPEIFDPPNAEENALDEPQPMSDRDHITWALEVVQREMERSLDTILRDLMGNQDAATEGFRGDRDSDLCGQDEHHEIHGEERRQDPTADPRRQKIPRAYGQEPEELDIPSGGGRGQVDALHAIAMKKLNSIEDEALAATGMLTEATGDYLQFHEAHDQIVYELRQFRDEYAEHR